jgi:hypothetical protein
VNPVKKKYASLPLGHQRQYRTAAPKKPSATKMKLNAIFFCKLMREALVEK